MSHYKERVLVLPRTYFDPKSFSGTLEDFKTLINNHAIFIDRDVAEVDENYLQIIPYTAVIWKDEKFLNDKIFLYERLKKGTEARLHSKSSVGIGGHIEQYKDFVSLGNNMDAVFHCATRELTEELKLDSVNANNMHIGASDSKFLIYDDSNPVGRVHLGLILRLYVDTYSVSVRETEKISGSMVYISSILTHPTVILENWTKELLQAL